MPKVGKKRFPYTPAGVKAAKKFKQRISRPAVDEQMALAAAGRRKGAPAASSGKPASAIRGLKRAKPAGLKGLAKVAAGIPRPSARAMERASSNARFKRAPAAASGTVRSAVQPEIRPVGGAMPVSGRSIAGGRPAPLKPMPKLSASSGKPASAIRGLKMTKPSMSEKMSALVAGARKKSR